MRTASFQAFLLLGSLLAAACGDDTTAGSGGGGDGTTASTSVTATSTASSATASSSASSAAAGTGGSGGGDAATCLPDEAIAVLQAHLDEMSSSAELLAGHGGVQEATSLLSAPALPSPPAIAAQYASLFMPCVDGDPSEFEEYCDGGLCSRIGCSGEGASWHVTAWSEEPVENEGFAIETAEIVHAWTEGDDSGTDVTIRYAAAGPDDRNWDFEGQGRFQPDGLSLTYDFAGWVAGHGAEMTWTVTPDGTTGEIVAAGVVVAEVDDEGHFVATGDCPPPT
jgi:hypothetical protein